MRLADPEYYSAENIIMFESMCDDVSPEGVSKLRFPYKLGEPFLVGYDGAREVIAESELLNVEDWRHRIYLAPERLDIGKTRAKYTIRHDIYSLGVILLEVAYWEDFTDEGNRYGKTFKSEKEPLKLLMKLAERIPILFGDKYRNIVVACLKQLDDEKQAEELNDENGIVVGTAYISQVLSKLDEIAL